MRLHAKAPALGSTMREAGGGLSRSFRGVFACFLALVVFYGISASSAMAAETRIPESFSPLEEPETGDSTLDPITDPNGIAIDEESGNVFVNDAPLSPEQANGHTEILGAEGGPPPALLSPYQVTSGCAAFSGSGPNINGVAVDNSATSPAKGTVYVVCTDGNIRRYSRNPVSEKYEAGAEITYPGSASSAGAAVDTDGNLFVSDFADRAVYKFDPTGVLLETISVASNGIVRPAGLAVDSAGDLFIQRAGTNRAYKCPADLTGVINPSACFEFLSSGVSDIAVDPTTDTLFVALGNRVAQYDAIGLSEEFTFGAGALTTTRGIAVNSATDRVYVSDTGTDTIVAFGAPIPAPEPTTKSALNVTGTRATLNGTVNPNNIEITECRYEYGLTTSYGTTASCAESIPTDFQDHAATAAITGLQPDGTTYHYRLVVDTIVGEFKGADRTLVTLQTAVSEAATDITDVAATLHGSVRPEGAPLAACFFEYGETSLYGQTVPCSPGIGLIPEDFDAHTVSGALFGLEPNTDYHYRLVKENASGTSVGADLSFTTQGAPVIVEQRPLDVGQTSALLRAKINPAGKATSYHFEWGEGTSYDKRIPADFEQNLAAGSDPVAVFANVSGLEPQTAYSFRAVATSAHGQSTGPDQPFETLNELDLPNDRAFELVSPADKRPVGAMEQLGVAQPYYQAAANGDRIGYLILNGLDGSRSGGEVIYAGSRSDDGWSSTEITPPALVPAPEGGFAHFGAVPGFIRYLDPYAMQCSLVETHNPLTADTPQASLDFGVYNLYRWNADGTYTLITNQFPLDPSAPSKFGVGNTVELYTVVGASEDCSRVLFRSKAYSFISGATGLYEWNEEDGVLRDAGLRPDGSVPTTTAPSPQLDPQAVAGEKNSVARDGTFFFTATSNQGSDTGKKAIFVSKGPGEVINASQAIAGAEKPTLGARYAGASPDGGRVFFLANCGIAATSCEGRPMEDCSSIAPSLSIPNSACDLYAYDVEEETLTDISVDANPADTKGPVLQGLMAMSDDGSVVYFAARGQLVPDRGRTYAQNLAGSGHANVYRYDADAPAAEALAYVGSLAAEDVRRPALTISRDPSNGWSSQTNSNGSYFLFGSRDDLSIDNPTEAEGAYLYSAATGSTVCISCPADGTAPKARPFETIAGITGVVAGVEPATNVQPVSLSEDGRAIFSSEDALAPGAVEGEGEYRGTALVKFLVQNNIYEWNQDQLSTLATGAVETLGMGGPNGRDIFIKSFDRLSEHDFDFSADVYDLRSGGGFPPPLDAPEPCDPTEGACQGPASDQPAPSSIASAAFQGPGNPPPSPEGKPRKRHCATGKVRRRGRCVKAKRTHRAAKRAAKKRKGAAQRRRRAAKTNRGGVQ